MCLDFQMAESFHKCAYFAFMWIQYKYLKWVLNWFLMMTSLRRNMLNILINTILLLAMNLNHPNTVSLIEGRLLGNFYAKNYHCTLDFRLIAVCEYIVICYPCWSPSSRSLPCWSSNRPPTIIIVFVNQSQLQANLQGSAPLLTENHPS